MRMYADIDSVVSADWYFARAYMHSDFEHILNTLRDLELFVDSSDGNIEL